MENYKKDELIYEELKLPIFVNNSPAVSLTVHEGSEGSDSSVLVLPFSDAAKAAVLSGCSFLNIGDTRCGKSQLMRDIHENYFGGDVDNGGKSTLNVARNDFSSDAYFMTINQDGVGEGKGMLSAARVPVERRIKSLCNIVDEVNLAIPEVQVEFFGMAESRHKGLTLGDKGYNLFMASCNLNRINGDFAGTSQINRALLNRFGVTFDFDFFRKTDEDDDILASRGAVDGVQLRDISEKIINAYQEISRKASQKDPFIDAYIRFLSSGLEYCDKDKDKRKKKIWPAKCGSCNFPANNLCSMIKQSNTGTTQTLKRFAHGLDFLAHLKQGNEISIEPLDLIAESFKFTTYHGNLNSSMTLSDYSGEDQEQMRDSLTKLKDSAGLVRTYMDGAIYNACEGNAETRVIRIGDATNPDLCIEMPYSDSAKAELDLANQELKMKKKKQASYQIFDPFDRQACEDFAKKTGLRIDWFPSYIKSVADF